MLRYVDVRDRFDSIGDLAEGLLPDGGSAAHSRLDQQSLVQ